MEPRVFDAPRFRAKRRVFDDPEHLRCAETEAKPWVLDGAESFRQTGAFDGSRHEKPRVLDGVALLVAAIFPRAW